jgi:hypothetical protein
MADFDHTSMLRIPNEQLEQAKFKKTALDKIAVRVGNEEDSPLYVTFTDGTGEADAYIFDETADVDADVLTKILTYTVPPVTEFNISSIICSGDNTAKYTVKINDNSNKVKRSYYGATLNVEFNYNSFKLDAGDKVEVFVVHHAVMAGDFEATIEGKVK